MDVSRFRDNFAYGERLNTWDECACALVVYVRLDRQPELAAATPSSAQIAGATRPTTSPPRSRKCFLREPSTSFTSVAVYYEFQFAASSVFFPFLFFFFFFFKFNAQASIHAREFYLEEQAWSAIEIFLDLDRDGKLIFFMDYSF